MKRMLKIIFAGQVIRVLLVVATLVCMLFGIAPLSSLDNLLYDQLVKFRPAAPSESIVVVSIDETSIAQIGSWPWPRTFLADGISLISEQNPAAIGVHILLPGREWNPALAELRSLRNELTLNSIEPSIEQSLIEMEAAIDGDSRLQAVVNAFGRVAVPFLLIPETDDLSNRQNRAGSGSVTPSGYSWEPPVLNWQESLATFHNPFRPGTLNGITPSSEKGVLASYLLSEQEDGNGGGDGDGDGDGGEATIYHGHINYSLDYSDRVRQLSLLKPLGNTLYPAFALQLVALADLAWSEAGNAPTIKPEVDALFVNGKPLLTGEDFTVYCNPAGESDIVQYSFIDVINGTLPEETFKDKIVLIGLTESFVTDGGIVEISDPPAVISTAAIVASLVSDHHVTRPYWAFMLEVAILFYLAFFLVLILPRLPLGLGWSLQVLFGASWVGAVASLLLFKGLWFQLAPHLVFVVVGLLLISVQRYLASQGKNFDDLKMLGLSFQSQGQLDTAFEKFSQCPVSDKSVKEILYNLGLDFERKRMFNKAIAVYTHLLKGGKFKDTKTKIAALQAMEKSIVFGGGAAKDGTLILTKGATAPTLGRYEVVRELGQGAMGTVYLGRDPKINREVAIKTLNLNDIDPDQLQDVKERFFREAEAAGRLNHPHIVTIYDAGEEHDLAYMAMEYLVGEDLSSHCSENTLLPFVEVLRIAATVADALAYAHDNAVIHRDIKPSNLMLLEDGKVKVTDFGIARVVNSSQTQTGTIIGTPSYMSPEQVSGERVKGRSDLFSLGVVCYELLSGKKPFVGDNLGALMHNIANVKYTPLKRVRPDLPECCYAVVRKLLKREVKDRYGNATEVVDALRKCIEKVG